MRDIAAVSSHAVLHLEFRRGRAHVEELPGSSHEFLEIQRPIVQGARQTETVLDEGGFADPVAFVHASDLRNARMRLVHDEQEIAREEVEQRVRARAGRASAEMARVVLDPAAKSHLLDHFQIIFRSHFQPLRLEQLALLFEPDDARVELLADRGHRALQLVVRGDELLRRVERHQRELLLAVAGKRVETGNPVDFIAEEFDAHGRLILAGRLHFHHIAANTEFAAPKADVVALVKHLHQLRERHLARDCLADFHREQHILKVLRRPEAVDARDSRHDEHIAPGEERAGRREPQALDLLVDRRILLDVRIGAGDVSLRLVVIEIGDEVLDRVFGEELLELRVELGGEGLIVGDDQRRGGTDDSGRTLAAVKVLPEPVTPSSVWCLFPASTDFVSLAMACAWSPRGS